MWLAAAATSILVATPVLADTDGTEAPPDPTEAPAPAPPPPTEPPPPSATTEAPAPEPTTATTSPAPTDEPTTTVASGDPPDDAGGDTSTSEPADTTSTTVLVTESDEELISGPVPLADTGEVRVITFPMVGRVQYYNDWGACRDLCLRYHRGNDLIGQARLQPIVAMVDGTVHHLINHPTAGYGIAIVDGAGWRYDVYHLNNDTPGTDDGADGGRWRFAAGVAPGASVRAGELIGWMGDSGNSEHSVPHAHVEIHRPDGRPINPYWSLLRAERAAACVSNTRLGVAPSPSVDRSVPASALSAWFIALDGQRVWLDGVAVYLERDGYASSGGPLTVGRSLSRSDARCDGLSDRWLDQARRRISAEEPSPEPAEGSADAGVEVGLTGIARQGHPGLE